MFFRKNVSRARCRPQFRSALESSVLCAPNGGSNAEIRCGALTFAHPTAGPAGESDELKPICSRLKRLDKIIEIVLSVSSQGRMWRQNA